jgi:hypothetical protein
VPAIGVFLVTAGALLAPACKPGWWDAAACALVLLALPAAVLLGWCLTVLAAGRSQAVLAAGRV